MSLLPYGADCEFRSKGRLENPLLEQIAFSECEGQIAKSAWRADCKIRRDGQSAGESIILDYRDIRLSEYEGKPIIQVGPEPHIPQYEYEFISH